MRHPDSPEFKLCNICGLCNNNSDPRLPIAGEGPIPADIMFIGQAPGKVEQRTGSPFQGPAGHQLDLVIEEAGLHRRLIYITNLVKQRPDDGGKDRKPTYAEMAACVRWLTQEMLVVRPKVVVLFGETAQQIAFPGLKPAQVQGLMRTKGGMIFLGAYHPAFILYRQDPEIRNFLVDTVKKAKRLVDDYALYADRMKWEAALELMPNIVHEAAS